MKAFRRTSKKIGLNNIIFTPRSLYRLNDGRFAIGGDKAIIIYNMKTYRYDIIIKIRGDCKFFLQLKDNHLFYYTKERESEGPAEDLYFFNELIELSGKEYKNKTNILPVPSRYNILRQISDTILYGGINYYKKEFKTDKCLCTNAIGPNRIERIVKFTVTEKYEIVTSFQIEFNDFIQLQESIIAVLKDESLSFYDVDKLFTLKKTIKIKEASKNIKFETIYYME